MTLDDIRKAMPHLGFALYALEPGGPVTFEVHAGDDVWAFTGRTEAAALRAAFPELAAPAAAIKAAAAAPPAGDEDDADIFG